MYGNDKIVEYLIPAPQALIYCFNSLHSSGKAFHKIVELDCSVLLTIIHLTISGSSTDYIVFQ